ncbi:SGNH/GDSL hydrolase family protein [Coraliomargarita sp. W4R53]
MKKLLPSIALLLCISTSTYAGVVRDDGWRHLVGPDKIQATQEERILDKHTGEAYQIDDTKQSGILIHFSTETLELNDSVHSILWWPMTTTGQGLSPCIEVSLVEGPIGDKIRPEQLTKLSETTLRVGRKGPIGLQVTPGAANFLKDGKAAFYLRAQSAAGTAQKVEFKGNAWLGVTKQTTLRYDEASLLEPFWSSRTMVNETLLPTQYDDAPATARLRFAPTTIHSVRNYALDVEYTEGKDYTIEGQTLTVLPNSQIPTFRYDELYPQESQAEPKVARALDGGYLILGESALFNDHQLTVTYDRTEAWTGPIPQSAKNDLPKTFSKLEKGEPLRLIVFGDSISVGASASGKSARAPFMPRWSELVASSLQRFYGSEITHINPSMGGMRSDWGKENAASLVSHQHPDLVILGFGMNDAGANFSAETFKSNTESIIQTIRQDNPDTEFLLLMSFQPNSAWRNLDLMESYLDALNSLQSDGITVADLWTPHAYLLKGKTYWDMTGNHVNHPNDFLVRLYAQVILARLGLR